jgi:hypothetical protein
MLGVHQAKAKPVQILRDVRIARHTVLLHREAETRVAAPLADAEQRAQGTDRDRVQVRGMRRVPDSIPMAISTSFSPNGSWDGHRRVSYQ